MSTMPAVESAAHHEGQAMPHNNRSKQSIGVNPKPEEIRAAREKANLTQAAAAELIHSTVRSWENWESQGDERRNMHPALFELFLAKTGQLRREYYDKLLAAKVAMR